MLQIKVRRKDFYFEIMVQSDFQITETSLYVNGSQITPVNATDLVKICLHSGIANYSTAYLIGLS